MPTIHLLIKGKVQGVFYRATAKRTALALGICGWVRNREDGNVEALVTGTPTQLHEFTDWCRTGPPGAVVKVVVQTEEEEIIFDSFFIKH